MAARGRPPLDATQPWTDALRMAVNEATEKGQQKKLRRIANVVVDKALDGDMAAIKELADRLQGRSVQPVDSKVESSVMSVELIDPTRDPVVEDDENDVVH